MWGHNNGNLEPITSDIPAGVQARFERVWRVNETNATGTAVNVGNINMRFDLTGLGPVTATDLRLLVDTDNDGTFVDETPIAGATSIGGGVYQFAGVTAISNNVRFTLGTANSIQTPLPIELLNFTAVITPKNEVKIMWQTASETNNDFFTIERSVTESTWEALDEIDGASNSTSTLSYSYIDESPILGRSYYRLKQTDYDGQFEYSKTVSISIQNLIRKFSIYPNPAKDKITINGSPNELLGVRLFNMLGQDVTPFTVIEKLTENSLTMELSNLNSGMYLVRTKTSSYIVCIE
jgi:hypothetical protein